MSTPTPQVPSKIIQIYVGPEGTLLALDDSGVIWERAKGVWHVIPMTPLESDLYYAIERAI